MRMHEILNEKYKPWTEEDNAELERLYLSGITSLTKLGKLLGGRNLSVINTKLNILFPDRKKRDNRPWTEEDNAKLKRLYLSGITSLTKLGKLLGGRNQGVINTKLNILFPDRKKQDKRPFIDKEIAEMRKRFMEGHGYTAIGLELDRSPGSIRNVIKRQKDYETGLLPPHLENLQQLNSTSSTEIDFFNTLEKELETSFHNRNIKIKRNHSMPREGKRPYNVDGIEQNQKLAIEFFGTLWHADPVVYPNPDQYLTKLSCTAGEIRNYDKKKIAWLTKTLGKPPVIIWEREWKEKSTKQECIDRVLTSLGLI